VSQLPKLQTLISVEDMLDDSYQVLHDIRDYRKDFEAEDSLFVALEPTSVQGFTWSDVCLLEKWSQDIVFASDYIKNFWSPFHMRKPRVSPGKVIYPKLINAPCGHLAPHTAFVNPLRDTPYGLLLTDKEGRDLLFEVEFESLKRPGPYGFFAPERVDFLVNHLQHFINTHNISAKIRLGGPVAFNWHMSRGMQEDQKINLYALAVVIILFRIFFGTWKGGFLICLSLLFAGGIMMGTMAGLGVPIDVLGNSLFIMLVVSSLQDFLFISGERQKSGQSYQHTVLKLAFPCFITSLTTILGFASLYFTQINAIQRFGIWAAFGALLEWIALFIVMPALLQLKPSWQDFVSLKLPQKPSLWNYAFYKFSSFAIPRWSVYPLMLSLLLAMGSAFFLNVDDDPRQGFPKSHPLRQDATYFEKNHGWEVDITLVDRFKNPADRERLLGEIGSLTNVVSILTSNKLEDYLTYGLEPLIADLVRREFRSSPDNQRFVSQDGSHASLVLLKKAELSSMTAIEKKVRKHCPARECSLVGSLVAYKDFSSRVIPSLLESFVMSLLLVSLVLASLAYFRSELAHIGPLLIGSFWGVLMMLGLYSIMGISVNYVTCIFASVLVGMAGDNAVQYLLASDRENLSSGMDRLGDVSVKITAIISTFAMLFVLSVFRNPRILGSLFCIGFIACMIGDLWILRALLDFFKGKIPSLKRSQSTVLIRHEK
jgi:predicted RND superfamily exporter protein